jgi:Fic family protein
VAETSLQASLTAGNILTLFGADRQRLEGSGRAAGSALRLHQHLQSRPIITIPSAARQLGVAEPTVAKSVALLQSKGILRETTGRQRNRRFVYDEYLRLLGEGTEPIPPG